MAHKIYSIESRKGGVGKTTVALNLASILVKRGPVLLLDCDITGTSIVDPAKNSSFWEEETNVLTFSVGNGDTKDINFLEYFLKQYIKGDGNARAILKPEKLMVTKVNVLGSFLFGKPQEAAINSSWLMDELHSYWMVEFIKQIVKEFEGIYAGKTVHVIIDNSPGYTSFNQSLHDYMFEIGPEDAKFLLVSTLDSQDLQANMETAAEIKNNVSTRIKVARFFKEKEREKDKEDEFRNIEVEALIEEDDDIKDFFFDLIEKEHLKEIYSREYKPEDYLALVLNKVPQSLQDNDTEVAYNQIIEERFDLFLSVAGAEKTLSPKNVVYYDEAIVYQYYLKYLRGRLGDRPSDAAYWRKRFRELHQQVTEASTLSPMAAMKKLNSSYDGLKSSLNQRGYAQIARQMVWPWAPEYAIDILKAKIAATTTMRWYNASDIPPQKMKDILRVWNREQLMDLRGVMGEHSMDFAILSDLVEELELYAGVKDDKRRSEPMVSISLLLYLFKLSYLNCGDLEKSLRSFTLHEWDRFSFSNIFGQAFDKPITVNAELTLNVDSSHRYARFDFMRIYSSFCYTILRLIDQQTDCYFILAAVRLYVPSIPALSFSKEMTDYISNVVSKKRLEPNSEQLAEIKARSYIMKNMQDVLKENVLKAWK